jgi:hypothetical protein
MERYSEEEKERLIERNRKEVLTRVEASFLYFMIEAKYRIMVHEAFTSQDLNGVKWDFMHSDGGTGFKELHKSSYAPYFVWHDYQMTRFKLGVSKYKNLIDLNLDFQKILEVYEFGRLKTYLMPISALIAFKLFKR